MAKLTQKYEAVVIFSMTQGEEGIAQLVERFGALIAENGTIELFDEWGKRRLAYPINDELEGFYVLWNFVSGPDFPQELTRVLGITEGVLRSLIVTVE